MKRILAIFLAIAACLPLLAQPRGMGSLRPTPDKWAEPTGPHKVVMEVFADFPDYTIYRPADLDSFKEKSLHAVVMMGPGCNPDGDSFRPFWTEVAS